MAEVVLEIGGRSYDVTCRDGDEDHLRTIAQLVDGKARDARQSVGDVNETRQLLFAALLLADELEEARRTVAELSGPSQPGIEDQTAYPLLATTLEQLADRVDAVLDRFESTGRS